MNNVEKRRTADADGPEPRMNAAPDFRMVTFSLGGKHYGIDIMDVKEISKSSTFTYVPNAAPFVLGVHNLRGDIIPIIDLRIMFNLPAERRPNGQPEDIVFLRCDDHAYGCVVDRIDNVEAVSSAAVQPPHPLFADVNLKYIRGVADVRSELFILLDVEAIFGRTPAGPEKVSDAPRQTVSAPAPSDLGFSFITESLRALLGFHVSEVNAEWAQGRFEEWRGRRASGGESIQITSVEDALDFVADFPSAETGVLWSEDRAKSLESALPDFGSALISAWDAGCGQGHEAYSIAAVLKRRYPSARVKVWAHDKDLLKVSAASGLAVSVGAAPAWIAAFLAGGGETRPFSSELCDAIHFEYHDIVNANPLPPVNLIVARDLLSYLPNDVRAKVLADFGEKLAPGGLLVLGDRESIDHPDWERHEKGAIRWYTHV